MRPQRLKGSSQPVWIVHTSCGWCSGQPKGRELDYSRAQNFITKGNIWDATLIVEKERGSGKLVIYPKSEQDLRQFVHKLSPTGKKEICYNTDFWLTVPENLIQIRGGAQESVWLISLLGDLAAGGPETTL